jgi:hypothetical protein
MKLYSKFTVAIALLSAFVISAVPLHAQYNDHDRHPAYLHALRDLRMMRAYLDRLTPNERIDDASQNAIVEIDAAIREIRKAAIDDGRDLRDHPPIDVNIAPFDRFHRAREAGNSAFAEIDREEENEYAHGLKHRALDHIAQANQIVDHIIEHLDRRHEAPQQYVAPPPPPPPPPVVHPSYQRALGDLHVMRSYLDRATPREQIDGETQSAIDSVDAAIRDILQSTNDDDRNYRDHPQIDFRTPRVERLHLAREAGNRAWAEISHDMDFAFAGGLRFRSMNQIEHANHVIDHIIGRISH